MATWRRSEWRGRTIDRRSRLAAAASMLAATTAIVTLAVLGPSFEPTGEPATTRLRSQAVDHSNADREDQALQVTTSSRPGASPNGEATTATASPSTAQAETTAAETTTSDGPTTESASTSTASTARGSTSTETVGTATATETTTSDTTGSTATTAPSTTDSTEPATTTGSTDPPVAQEPTRFATLPPGAALPSGRDCAARVRPVAETVPENGPYNATPGGPVTGTYLSISTDIAANDLEARIDGDFTGSTDEIIQWAACKWGFDEDVVRAQAYVESSWYAGKLGDCGEATVPETGGCSSVGLIQVRSAESGFTHHPGVYPAAWHSTALNLDYALAVMRLCFDGDESWLAQTGDYRPGDHGHCMGRWFSGAWADAGSQAYQREVERVLAERPWEGPHVGCPDWQSRNHCGN